jgi:hypothetical protein
MRTFPQSSSRLGATQNFTLTAASQASAAFGPETFQIRVATNDQPAYIKIGDGTPTATANDVLMPAGWVDYFTVTPGQAIAVLQAGTAGKISITEIA